MAVMSSLKHLPDGFRLNPREDDLINYYLNRKLKDIPEPDGNCYIPQLDIYSYHPEDLVYEYDKMASIKSNGLECFFFCTLDEDPNRRCNIRKIAEGKKGFWHRTGKERKSHTIDKLEWAKRIFCHRVGTHRDFEQTDWVMHEFRLISDERFVLCRITKKPKKFSASAGKKRKDGSIDDNESHQETSTESCVLNDIIIAKKANNHTGHESQDHSQFLQEASSEASSSSNIWKTLLSVAENYPPELDINLFLKQL